MNAEQRLAWARNALEQRDGLALRIVDALDAYAQRPELRGTARRGTRNLVKQLRNFYERVHEDGAKEARLSSVSLRNAARKPEATTITRAAVRLRLDELQALVGTNEYAPSDVDDLELLLETVFV